MIPKVIHYCWFGRGKKPKLTQKCIASWIKHCPDYEVIEWNEDNFDVYENEYTKYCFENNKWAFLSDYVRLKVIYNNGGIYLDTDVEIVKPFDNLLEYDAFYGFENDKFVASGLGFGAVKNHCTVKAMLDEYSKLWNNDNQIVLTGCPTLNTNALLKLGLKLNGERQSICGAEVFSKEFFNPYDDPTGRLIRTDNTYSIHWYAKSALDKKSIFISKLTKPFHRVFGNDCFYFLKK